MGIVLYRQADDLPLLAQGVAVTLDGGAPGTLAVIRRVDREYEFLEMLIGLLAVLNIAGAVVALIAGRITAGRMPAPLFEMISRAQAIDAHALDTRLAQVLRPEEIDLPVFLAEIISDRREIDPWHEYSLRAEDGLRLRADPTLLRQLLLILLDNAAKYSPEGRGMHLSAAHCGTATRISLRDEGCGVPPDQLDRIFERFYRVDKARARATGGSGLGLAIARTIVSLHGGEIYAENAAEGGLRVTVKLPEG